MREELGTTLAKWGPGGEANAALSREAEQRGYCGEYDDIVREWGWWDRSHGTDDDWYKIARDYIAALDVKVTVRVNVPLSGFKSASAAEESISYEAIRSELRNTHGIRVHLSDIDDWSVNDISRRLSRPPQQTKPPTTLFIQPA